MADAIGWAREKGLSVDGDLSYLREFEHITLRPGCSWSTPCATGPTALGEAMELLGRLLRAAKRAEDR